MQQRYRAKLIVASYAFVDGIIQRDKPGHIVSILGRSDRLPWPQCNSAKCLRLEFDDVTYASGEWLAPTRTQIAELIAFARDWDGVGTLLVHCRAGSSRSPSAGLIALAAIGRCNLEIVVQRIARERPYIRPHSRMLTFADEILLAEPRLARMVQTMVRANTIVDVEPIEFTLPGEKWTIRATDL
jgi:predicted protein tyrosine phosphatase